MFNLKKIESLDKFLLAFVSLVPLSLIVSIFVADLMASLSGFILIYIFFFEKNNLKFFRTIKKEILFFSIFFIIILISFFINGFKSYSLLPSLFYFRYFLFALSIFYLLNKYNFLEKEFFFIIIITFSIVIFDSFIQLIFKKNIFGYISIDYEGGVTYLTSFFKDEKKLGSYLVRFLPLLLSLVVINNFKNSNKIEITILLISGIIIFYSSERVAFLLLLVVYFFYFLISNKKIYFIVFGILTIICLFTFNQNLAYKYTSFTLQQTGLIFLSNSKKNIKDKEEAKRMFKDNKLRYYSLEHENLSYTALIVAKENYLLGRGIKSFYSQCERLKKEKNNYNTKRNNQLLCSTHPHNTYLQLLSEIGVFGAVMIIYIFFKSFVSNLKLLFQNKINNTHKAWYFLNICIIINLMPLIPSGSFFNNWLSLMIFFPLGFWLYFKQRLS